LSSDRGKLCPQTDALKPASIGTGPPIAASIVVVYRPYLSQFVCVENFCQSENSVSWPAVVAAEQTGQAAVGWSDPRSCGQRESREATGRLRLTQNPLSVAKKLLLSARSC